MANLSCSNIVGYESHLPLKHVKLPLKYAADKDNDDAGDQFKRKAFGMGGFLDLSSQNGHFFSSLQYGLDNDRRTIHLVPILMDEVTSLSVQFQCIQFHLPHPVIGNKLLSLQFVTLEGKVEPYIAIDMIDESFLFVTLKVELTDFLVGNLNNRLGLDSFNDWLCISAPYSFELRSSPFVLKAFDINNLIVALEDGGLLHFARKSVLSSFDIYNFSEKSYLTSLSLGGIFKLTYHDKSVDGISQNAVVDAVKIDRHNFVTVSVRKVIKVWNLLSHQQLKQRVVLDQSLAGSSASWLTSIPSKHMQLHSVGNEQCLTFMYTSETDGQASSGYAFKLFKILPANGIAESATFTIFPERPQTTTAAEQNSFKIQDFFVQYLESTGNVNMFALWKSSTYSLISQYAVDSKTWTLVNESTSLISCDTTLEEIFPHSDLSHIRNSILNSGSFDDKIVATALEIFKSKSGHKTQKLSGSSLRQDVDQTIQSTSRATNLSESALWSKLHLLCEEFKKLSMEALSLHSTSSKILVCEVHGVGVYKPAHILECFQLTQGSGELSHLLFALSAKLSTNTKRKLMEEIKSLGSVNSVASHRLASTYLSGKISAEEISQIMEKLERLPNAMESIHNLIHQELCIIQNSEEMNGLKLGDGSGVFSRLLVVRTFKNIMKSHESILLNLFILFLLCENNSSISTILSDIVQQIFRYTVLDKIFGICFKTSSLTSEIERERVNLLEYSIFWTAAVRNYPNLMSMIRSQKFNEAFDYYAQFTLGPHYNQYLLDVVLDLLNRDEPLVVKEKFSSIMDMNLPVNKFLSGILSLTTNDPTEFIATFSDYSIFEGVNNEPCKDALLRGLKSHRELKTFISSLYATRSSETSSKAHYFHSLAQLGRSTSTRQSQLGPGSDSNKLLLGGSYNFERTALQIITELSSPDSELSLLKTELLRNLFDGAMELDDYTGAIDSLNKLSPLLSNADLKLLFSKLIRTLIAKRDFQRAYAKGQNSLFVKNYSIVDTILLETANNDLILSNAVKCYEFLYSWRLFGSSSGVDNVNLGDKRGAVEALYIFITRFKLEMETLGVTSNKSADFKQFKLKVLELYMIIINCLKTFEDTADQWFIRRNTAQRLGVIGLADITLEYYDWLKELELDLSEGLSS